MGGAVQEEEGVALWVDDDWAPDRKELRIERMIIHKDTEE